MFFIFLIIIFNINTLKLFLKYKNKHILNRNKFGVFNIPLHIFF